MIENKSATNRSKMVTSNRELRDYYDRAYRDGPAHRFSNFTDGEAEDVVVASIDWTGRRVLDVGCGTGRLARCLRAAGAGRVVGLDYTEAAIKSARAETDDEGVQYVCADAFDYSDDNKFDVITSLGTMEHMDDPAAFFKHLRGLLVPDGVLILTCPHFINLRGIAWMTLVLLQDVPMSLSDLQFIHPWQMERWCAEVGLKIDHLTTLDYTRGNGSRLIEDFTKRIPNALRDAGIDGSGAGGFLEYLKSFADYIEAYPEEVQLQGATACYVLSPLSDAKGAA